MHRGRLAFLIAVLICGQGCSSSKTLTRAKAQELIEASFAEGDTLTFRPYVLANGAIMPSGDGFTLEEHKDLKEREFYDFVNEPLYSSTCCPREVVGSQPSLKLTQLGEKFFAKGRDGGFTTTFRVRPRIEITGIKDSGQPGGTARVVNYTVDWFDEFPKELKPIFQKRPPVSRSTVMTLYDDGWRLGG